MRPMVSCGSPPRMRGQVEPLVPWTKHNRITPADAGTSSSWQKAPVHSWDHPRGCGDKGFEPMDPQVGGGSPPRMRGQGNAHPRKANGNGITPADAGTSVLELFHTSTNKDHPRGCGDKVISIPPDVFRPGSPPRMRGQVHREPGDTHSQRITPADAGTRRLWGDKRALYEDHPRGCGDKALSPSFSDGSVGSPPRMRGQVFAGIERRLQPGITPADAGTRLTADWIFFIR